jgi:hypothetical protein
MGAQTHEAADLRRLGTRVEPLRLDRRELAGRGLVLADNSPSDIPARRRASSSASPIPCIGYPRGCSSLGTNGRFRAAFRCR